MLYRTELTSVERVDKYSSGAGYVLQAKREGRDGAGGAVQLLTRRLVVAAGLGVPRVPLAHGHGAELAEAELRLVSAFCSPCLFCLLRRRGLCRVPRVPRRSAPASGTQAGSAAMLAGEAHRVVTVQQALSKVDALDPLGDWVGLGERGTEACRCAPSPLGYYTPRAPAVAAFNHFYCGTNLATLLTSCK